MAERAHDVILPDQRAEIARPPLAGQNLMRHADEEVVGVGEPEPRHSR